MQVEAQAPIFEFDLTFQLPADAPDPDQHVDALFEAGCDDALPGVGQYGYIALVFAREAETLEQAMMSALNDVRAAIPGARFVEAKPDLAGLSEIAAACGCSRQNVRKHLVDKATAPPPVHIGNPSLWHIAEVSDYLRESMRVALDEHFIESARAARRLNAQERGADDDARSASAHR